MEVLRSARTGEMIDERIDDLEKERHFLLADIQNGMERIEKTSGRQRNKETSPEILTRPRLGTIKEELRNLPDWKRSAQNFRYGNDLGGSDETLLTWHFDRPLIVHRYPAAVKAFYMKRDPADASKVLAMDVLAPEGYGEIIGGSQREDDLAILQNRIREHNLPLHAFEWFLDLRRYGSVPHSGFGLGVERTIAWICGLEHVREAIPFARLMNRITP